MSSIREQIIQAVIALIAGQTDAADRVFRSRVSGLDRDELPAIVVKPGDSKSTRFGSGVLQHEQEIRVELYGHGPDADLSLDPVLAMVHAKLAVDQTLGGLTCQIWLSSIDVPDFDDSDDSSTCVVLTYVAIFLTPQHDLTRSAG